MCRFFSQFFLCLQIRQIEKKSEGVKVQVWGSYECDNDIGSRYASHLSVIQVFLLPFSINFLMFLMHRRNRAHVISNENFPWRPSSLV